MSLSQYKKKRTSSATPEPFGGSADVLLIWEELKLFMIYHLNNYWGFVFLRDTFCALCGELLSTKVTKAFRAYPNDSIFNTGIHFVLFPSLFLLLLLQSAIT